jgi:hypothetical protein
MFYERSEDGKLRPTKVKPYHRPLNAHTIEKTVRTGESDVKKDLKPRPVTAYTKGTDNLAACFDLARSEIEKYVTWREQQTSNPTTHRTIRGVIAGEPWVSRPRSTPSESSLLTPIITMYGQKGDTKHG